MCARHGTSPIVGASGLTSGPIAATMPAVTTSYQDTAEAFIRMAHRIVWASVATVEPDGRPRTRILHPIWEWVGDGLVGWIATVQVRPEGLRRWPANRRSR